MIRKDDGHGNILLSRAEANDILAWEKLAQYKEEKTVLDVKVKGIVNAGVIAYVEGIRGFIPASKLSLNYVEDLNEYLNKDIQVQVFDLDKEKDRLILSAREILREKADEERKEKISNVEVGLVTEGTVESLQTYGAFIDLKDTAPSSASETASPASSTSPRSAPNESNIHPQSWQSATKSK